MEICSVCEKVFTANKNLRAHLKHVHRFSETEINEKYAPKKEIGQKNKCIMCNIEISREFHMLKNHFQLHDIEIRKQELEFQDENSFQAWKISIENKTPTRFIQRSGAKRTKQGNFHYNLYCCWKGNDIPEGKNKKIGMCPSSISVNKNNNGSVNIIFIETHVGHINDFNLSTFCSEIETKLTENIPAHFMLSDIKNEPIETQCMDSKLTIMHLDNIKRSIDLNSDYIRHSNDVSDDVVVKEEPVESSSCSGNADISIQKEILINKIKQIIYSLNSQQELDAVEKIFASIEPA